MIVIASRAGAGEAEAALRAAGETPVRLGEAIAASGEDRVAYRGRLDL